MAATSTPRIAVALGAATACIVVITFNDIPSPGAAKLIGNLAQTVAPALAALACWAAAKRAERSDHQRGWCLLGWSAAMWASGQVIWTVYEGVDGKAPFPSIADVGYLAAVPFALASIWSFSAKSRTTSWAIAALDGLVLASALLAVSWPIVLGPSWNSVGVGGVEFALTLAYPIGNLVVALSAIFAMIRSDRARETVPLGAISLGLLVLAVADSVFVWAVVHDAEGTTSFADPLWISGYLVLAVAARDFPRAGSGESEVPRPGAGLRRAAVPLSLVAVAVLLGLSNYMSGDMTNVQATMLASTTLLVLLRVVGTLRENQELTASLHQKIGELTAREEQLSHQAFHDPLTGLANRRLFSDRVEHALDRSRRTGDLTAVLFIDLDDFKTVNDSLGHAAGDRLLVLVAARLTGCVRPGDTVARLGGDEFGVLLEEMEGPGHPSNVARRILAALELAFPLDGRQVFTHASIGVASAVDHTPEGGADLLSDADVALYAAKAAGKSTYREFERSMRINAVERLELQHDLRQALEDQQFFCHYQPIVDLETGKVVAVEALVRWDHPTRGLVAPDDFVDIAEDFGVIGEIGMVVLEAATRQAAAWRTARHVPLDFEMHVNLSGRQLEDATLVERIQRVIGATGFPPELLVLEITESVAVDIGARHLGLLEDIRSLGIRIAIDDFGTGYSSLNYLRALPVDVLKIDRAFAQTVDGETDTVLLEAIVRLGHSLDIEMIAEGIEREEQAQTLRRLGCRLAQGFLFHRPLAVSQVPAVIAAAAEDNVPT